MNRKYISLAVLLGLLLSATPAASKGFRFSDFDFFRQADTPTKFHTKKYKDDNGAVIGKGLAAFKQFVHTEASAIDLDELEARRLDATKLKLNKGVKDLKVYFIHEGAGYRNQLKVDMLGKTKKSGFVFVDGSQGNGKEQLRKGDYVSLGKVQKGTTLDFSLLANGYKNSNFRTYYADIARNPDKMQHVMAYEFQGYLILAWEDLYRGGDKDYNDIVFAVDIGKKNLDLIPDDPISNKSPVAKPDSVTISKGTLANIDVLNNDFDPEGSQLTITEVDDFLAEGSVSIMGRGEKVVYTPAPNFHGQDVFSYTIKDSAGATASASVTVNVQKESIQAVDDYLTTPEDVIGRLNVLNNDQKPSNGLALEVLQVNGNSGNVGNTITLESGATVSISADGQMSYNPNQAFVDLNDGEQDSDSFTYGIDDGDGGISTATINVTISGVTGNSAPQAVDDSVRVSIYSKENMIDVLANDSDPDNDSLEIKQFDGQNISLGSTVRLTSGATIELIESNDGQQVLRYIPPSDKSEQGDSFSYAIDDGNGGVSTANVTITLVPAAD